VLCKAMQQKSAGTKAARSGFTIAHESSLLHV